MELWVQNCTLAHIWSCSALNLWPLDLKFSEILHCPNRSFWKTQVLTWYIWMELWLQTVFLPIIGHVVTLTFNLWTSNFQKWCKECIVWICKRSVEDPLVYKETRNKRCLPPSGQEWIHREHKMDWRVLDFSPKHTWCEYEENQNSGLQSEHKINALSPIVAANGIAEHPKSTGI